VVLAEPLAALLARGRHDDVRRRVEALLGLLLAGILGRAHERVELHVRGAQRVERARRGDEPARSPRLPERAAVAAGEVDRVDLVQALPRQVVVAARHDPVAEDGDRALPVGVEVDEAAALAARARRRVHAHAELVEALLRPPAEVVIGKRGEELALTGQLRELHGGDGTAAADLLPELARMDDLARARDVRHARELDPLDVADDGDTGTGRHRPLLCPQARGDELASGVRGSGSTV
jgi:hypothetical protein